MTKIDYRDLLVQTFDEYEKMLDDRKALDLEIAKKRQFISATMNMLPDDERDAFNFVLENLGGELGLTDAIRKVLQENSKKSFTATEVRNKLKESNFDFSSYKTNPLASIHAVLKRLKPEEVEATDIDGVAAWRWVGDSPPPIISEAIRQWFEFENSKEGKKMLQLTRSTLRNKLRD